MHSLFTQASGMTHDVIGAAIEVHYGDTTHSREIRCIHILSGLP